MNHEEMIACKLLDINNVGKRNTNNGLHKGIGKNKEEYSHLYRQRDT